MLIAVCSLKASPGVTTLATALAARWHAQENPIIAEADPSGGDLMARFRLAETPGLVSLAVAARRTNDPNLLALHTQTLPGGLRVVVGPVGAEQSRAALATLVSRRSSPLRLAADQPGTTVIADCGRVDPHSPALEIIREADGMLLLARPHDDELAHVALKLQTAQRWSCRPCLVLVGDGHSTRDVSKVLGIPVMGRVPHDDKGAAVLCGHDNDRHRPARSSLGRGAARIALQVSSQWRARNVAVPHPLRAPVMIPGGPGLGAALEPSVAQLRNGFGHE
jgi:hypothetical protein